MEARWGCGQSAWGGGEEKQAMRKASGAVGEGLSTADKETSAGFLCCGHWSCATSSIRAGATSWAKWPQEQAVARIHPDTHTQLRSGRPRSKSTENSMQRE